MQSSYRKLGFLTGRLSQTPNRTCPTAVVTWAKLRKAVACAKAYTAAFRTQLSQLGAAELYRTERAATSRLKICRDLRGRIAILRRWIFAIGPDFPDVPALFRAFFGNPASAGAPGGGFRFWRERLDWRRHPDGIASIGEAGGQHQVTGRKVKDSALSFPLLLQRRI